jgi:hypothetical protein
MNTSPLFFFFRKSHDHSLPRDRGIFLDLREPEEMDGDLPDDVIGSYVDDINIVNLHQVVRKYYSVKLFNLKRNPQASDELTFTSFISGLWWGNYVSSSQNLLTKYLSLASERMKGNLKIGEEILEDPSIVNERVSVIEEYIGIVKSIFSCSIVRKILGGDTFCLTCGYSFVEDECVCGYDSSLKIKREDESPKSGKSRYNSISTFIKRMDRFECKQKDDVSKVIPILDTYLVSKGYPSSLEVKSMREDRKRDVTSMKILIEALKNTSNTCHYKNCELISTLLWGWRVHNISHLRDGMIEDYSKVQEKYKKHKQRKSNLSVNYLLFLHLKARGYECSSADFKLVSTPSSLEENIKVSRKCFEEAGIRWTPI